MVRVMKMFLGIPGRFGMTSMGEEINRGVMEVVMCSHTEMFGQ